MVCRFRLICRQRRSRRRRRKLFVRGCVASLPLSRSAFFSPSPSPSALLSLPARGPRSRLACLVSTPAPWQQTLALDHQMVRACPRHSSHAAATPRIVALHRPPPAKTAPQTSKYRLLYLYLTSRPLRSLQISPRTCHFHSRKLPCTARTRGRDFLPLFMFFRKENYYASRLHFFSLRTSDSR